MPQEELWSPLVREWIEKENDCFGVYYLSSEDGETLYIGVGHILTSLRSHLTDGANPLELASRYRIEYVGNLLQANKNHKAALSNFVKANGAPPMYNGDCADRDAVNGVKSVA